MEAVKKLREIYPDAMLTVLVAKLLKTKTNFINRLFCKHDVPVRKRRIEVSRKMGNDYLKKKETFCYLYISDLQKLSLSMRDIDKPTFSQATISFVLKLQRTIFMLENRLDSTIYVMPSPVLSNLIDCKTLAEQLGITKRSVHKNKRYPKVIVNGKTYFDLHAVNSIIKERKEETRIKYNARNLLHRLFETGWKYQELYDYFGFTSESSPKRYMSQVIAQHKIGVVNAKKVIKREKEIKIMLKNSEDKNPSVQEN